MMNRKQNTAHESGVTSSLDGRWAGLPAVFENDRLTIGGQTVMEDWEREYMCRLAEVAGSKPERVLEVGFGMGVSSARLQRFEVEEHIVIEANREVYERLLTFAADAPGRIVSILGFWQNMVREIPDGTVSSILFDTHPLQENEVLAFFKEAHRLLKKGGVLTYYSNEASDFSREQRRALREAGFKDLRSEICTVSPPESCDYWREETLMVPIIFK